MHETERRALHGLVDELATDIGRIRRSQAYAGSLQHVADRLAVAIETVDCLVQLSAGELHRSGLPVVDALARVDRRARHLAHLLRDDIREDARARDLKQIRAAA